MASPAGGYGVYDGMDDATASTVIQVQIQDINRLLAFEQEDAQRQRGVISDWVRTLILHRNELQRSLILIRDRRMGTILANTIRQDAQAISNAIAEERQAEADHAMACRLAGLPVPPSRPEFANFGVANPTPPPTPRLGNQPLPAPCTGQTSQTGRPATVIRQSGAQVNTGTPRAGQPAPTVQRSGVMGNTDVPFPQAQANKNVGIPPLFGATSTSIAAVSRVNQNPTPVFDWGGSRSSIRGTGSAGHNTVVPASRENRTSSTEVSQNLTQPSNSPGSKETANPNQAPIPGLLVTPARTSGGDLKTSKKRSSETLGILEKENTKRPDTGANKGIELSRKRIRDDEENLDQLPGTKRVDTGQEKIVNLTGTHSPLLANRKRNREDQDETIEGRSSKKVDTESGKNFNLKATSTISCVSCGDEVLKIAAATVECKHEYCQTCLQTVVRNALVDEALYPPRCCKLPFTMDSMRAFLSPELISDFHQKKIEFATRNRTYCSNPYCSAFLYPVNIDGSIGGCPMCFASTCTVCKGAGHKGDCPKDEGVQQVLALGIEKGWKRCSHCSRMIELKVGCNHITCHCKAQWCYMCGVDWKNCACQQWDEERLLERAEQDINRQPPQANLLPAAPRPQQIAAQVQYLRHRHECDHEYFDKVGGYNECDECGRECRRYINRCERCNLLFCHGCKLNRLY